MRTLAVAAAATAAVVSPAWAAAPGTAAAGRTGTTGTTTSGTPGACPTADGVTVVVDFQGLGRDTVVRCAPGSPSSGFDALTKAGISFTQVSSNPGFMCKIEGLPAPEGYANRCSVIPPTSAYWGYWVAARGSGWCYSSVGASRTPPPGTVEGWSFSAGTSEAGAPPPRVAPPAHVTGAPTSVSKASCPSTPTTTTPAPASVPTTARPAPGPSPVPGGSGGSSGSGGSPDPSTGTPGAPPAGPVPGPEPDGGTTPVDSSDADPATSVREPPSRDDELAGDTSPIRVDDTGGDSPVGLALGLGAVAVVGATAVVTARRRGRSAPP